MKKFYDTCGLLNAGDDAFTERFTIAQKTLEEIENIKTSANKDEQVKYKARHTAHLLDEHFEDYDVVFMNDEVQDVLGKFNLPETPDNIILASAYVTSRNQDIVFITDDVNVKVIAKKVIGLHTESNSIKNDLYVGYETVMMSDEEMAEFYQNRENKYGLVTNQYLLIQNEASDVVDTVRWNGEDFIPVGVTPFKSNALGNIKPLDDIQKCAMDSIVNNDITVLYGRAGSGKTSLPLAYAMKGVEKGKIAKIYVVYSFEPLKNSRQLGFEKGSHQEKLLYYGSVGNILATKLGDLQAVEYLMNQNMLDIIPTAYLRGVEFGEDSFVLVTEGQNLSTYALKTLIQRCKTGSKLVVEGDFLEQQDANIGDIGMRRVVEVFKGNEHFGCVKLKYNYRSEISELADMM